MQWSDQKGLTFVEALVVMAIIAILAVFVVSVFQNMNTTSALRVSTQEVYTSLLEARNNTLASNDDTIFGVHIEEEEMILFTGATYSSTSPSSTVYALLRGVTATSSLTGGAIDIVFQRLTGFPSATGTITLFSETQNASTTLTIYGSGLVEEQI